VDIVAFNTKIRACHVVENANDRPISTQNDAARILQLELSPLLLIVFLFPPSVSFEDPILNDSGYH
jgi:hypothetical protein